MSDYISRADAIEAVCRTRCGDKAKGCPAHSCLVIEEFDALPSADAEQGFRGGKIPPKETLGGTVLIPQHQWLDMERELAELKDRFESADAVHGEWKFVDHGEVAGEYFCSICGKRAEVDLYGEWILSNYCGYCGSRMKGGGDE